MDNTSQETTIQRTPGGTTVMRTRGGAIRRRQAGNPCYVTINVETGMPVISKDTQVLK